VPLELTESGRPIVRAGGLDLSIAHAGPHVLVAIVDGGRRIGVDVEGGPGAPVPGDALLEVVCTRTERARLRAIHPDARGDAFLGVWTRKEAVLKADGRGLLVDPTTLEVSVGGFPRLVRGPAGGPEPARVLLLDLPAAPGFRAALAVVG
jgi:4'-phosphopantetheinyl transferase